MCLPAQVGRCVGGHAVCPQHPVPTAGEREGGGRLPGGQDDQPHAARRLHTHRKTAGEGSIPRRFIFIVECAVKVFFGFC